MSKVESPSGIDKTVEDLRALYNRGQGRRELFDHLATYSTRRTDLTAERAAEATSLSYETVIKIFKELDELDIGAFTLGRKGAKTRITWARSPKSVGDAARGAADKLKDYDFEEYLEPSAQLTPAKQDAQSLIVQAKIELAAKLGISPDQITITVNLIA